MNHPMIDFDVVGQAREVARIARMVQSGRKPFHCLMSGRGTGKTRTLCELHSELLKEGYNCLSLAITFNHRWADCRFLTEGSNSKRAKTKTEIALEVISRLASVLYGQNHVDIQDILEAKDVFSVLKSTRCEDLLKAFLEHAVVRVRKTGRKVDYVVIHIDESVELAKGIIGDGLSCIRNGILDAVFEGNFTAGLVISSLKAGPIGLTLSGRSAIPINKPTVLTIDTVLSGWVGIRATSSSRLLLTLLNRLPRSIQILQTNVLWELPENQNQQNDSLITTGNFHSFIASLTKGITEYYGELKFIGDNTFRKIIFGENLKLTKETESLIIDGVFTNNIRRPIIGDTIFTPEANALMMYVSLSEETGRGVMKQQFLRTVDTTIELLAGISSGNIGRILEYLFLQHLLLRLYCTAYGSFKLSLQKLLGLDKMSLASLPIKRIMRSNIPLLECDRLSKTVDAVIPSLSATNDAFKQFLEKEIPETLDVGVWKSAEGDSFDALIMLRRPDRSPFFIFVELKSTAIKLEPVEATRDDVRKFLGDYRQLNATRGNLVDIIAPESYLYVYLLADDEVKSFYDKEGGCLIIGGDEAGNFFGPFYDLYRALRALVNDPILRC